MEKETDKRVLKLNLERNLNIMYDFSDNFIKCRCGSNRCVNDISDPIQGDTAECLDCGELWLN